MVAIAGATGYTGLELTRLLLQHPKVSISHLFSKSYIGQEVTSIYPQLTALRGRKYEAFDPSALPSDIDVLFLALPHGQSNAFMPTLKEAGITVIDLAADFRLSDVSLYNQYYGEHQSSDLLAEVPYGLPELFRASIKDASIVAIPGCYPTATILGAYPLIKAGLGSSGIVVDAKSGVSGAGRSLKETSLLCEASENISAYGTGVHRHTSELTQFLEIPVVFSPHLVPMKRGILASIYIRNELSFTQSDVEALFSEMYAIEPFIVLNHHVSMPGTKFVSGSNRCQISAKVLDASGMIVVSSAIDNLIKGASGQAVQVLNIVNGWDEVMGLDSIPPYI